MEFYEVADGFAVHIPAPEKHQLTRIALRILEASEVDIWDEDAPPQHRNVFFKKSDGWTREVVEKMVDTFNGSGI